LKQLMYVWRRRFSLCMIIATLLCAIVGCQKSGPAAAPAATPAPVPTPVPTPEYQLSPAPVDSASPTPIPGEAIDGVADPDEVLPQFASYKEAKAINEEVIGWITVPNTKIDYPVVRCNDNEFYLTHNVEKDDSDYGAIFMDFRNANEGQQRHIILYGHNMKNGTMFHDLNNYKQRSFFDENRVITFLWDNVETKWEIYAAYVIKNNDVYYIHTRFGSDENYVEYMNALIDYAKNSKYSVVDEAVTIKASDQVLTLSTCTYEYDNSRFAVSARRIS